MAPAGGDERDKARSAERDPDPSVFAHYLRGLETSTKHNSVAYGYSVTITAAFALVLHSHGRPSVVDIFLFALGAGLAFAVINTGITRGYRSRFPEEPAVVVALGTSFSVVSISLALAAAASIGWALAPWPAWPLASFGTTVVYILALGVELALAGELHEAGGLDADEERRHRG